MIVHMKNEYLGHILLLTFLYVHRTLNITVLGYSSDPMHDAYYIVVNNKDCFEIIIINIIYNR